MIMVFTEDSRNAMIILEGKPEQIPKIHFQLFSMDTAPRVGQSRIDHSRVRVGCLCPTHLDAYLDLLGNFYVDKI
jgi:hypothetical protein